MQNELHVFLMGWELVKIATYNNAQPSKAEIISSSRTACFSNRYVSFDNGQESFGNHRNLVDDEISVRSPKLLQFLSRSITDLTVCGQASYHPNAMSGLSSDERCWQKPQCIMGVRVGAGNRLIEIRARGMLPLRVVNSGDVLVDKSAVARGRELSETNREDTVLIVIEPQRLYVSLPLGNFNPKPGMDFHKEPF